jgi:hypothetical protein
MTASASSAAATVLAASGSVILIARPIRAERQVAADATVVQDLDPRLLRLRVTIA